jgi:hypothetical protein
MSCKNKLAGTVACGVALSFLAFAQGAKAQSETMTKGADGAGMDMSMQMSNSPMLVTGTVLRYYTDRAGYVTAMDVQTANGVQFVRFSPSIGQRLYTTYPVGGTASVYVSGTPYMGSTRYDVVSVGTVMPTSMGMMSPTMSDVELLDAQPVIMAGAKMVTVRGKLNDIVTNNNGEVVGLVLGGTKASEQARMNMMAGTTMAGTTNSTMPMMMPAMMPGTTLVRVPREFRHTAPGFAGTERVTPLFRGADVEVTGYPEAPRYGVLSTFENRVAASALVVNSRAVGAVGIQRMMSGTGSLFRNVDLGGSSRSAEEMRAMQMGYSMYGTSAANTSGTMTTDTSVSGTTSETTTTR